MATIKNLVNMKAFNVPNETVININELSKETVHINPNNRHKGVKSGQVWRVTNTRNNSYFLFLVLETGSNDIVNGFKIYNKNINDSEYTFSIHSTNGQIIGEVDILRNTWAPLESFYEKISDISEESMDEVYNRISSYLRITPSIKVKYDKQIADMMSVITELKKDINAYEAELEMYKKENTNLSRTVGKNKSLKEKAEDRAANLETQLSNINREYDKRVKENKELKEQLEKNIKYIKELEERPNENEKVIVYEPDTAELDKLKKEKNDLQIRIYQLEGQIELLKNLCVSATQSPITFTSNNMIIEQKKEKPKKDQLTLEDKKAKAREYHREYYKKNKERIEAKRKERDREKKENGEKTRKEKRHEQYIKNRDKELEYAKKYREEHKK